jgi:hypothetical protein
MPELPLAGLAGGHRARRWALAVHWQRLGQGLFREDRLRLRLELGQWPALCFTAGTDRLAGAGPCRRAAVSALGVRFPLASALDLRLDWPLTSPPPWQGERCQRRWLLLTARASGVAWALGVDRSGAGVPSLQGELCVRLHPAVATGVRSEPATGSLGRVTVWRRGRWLLRSSHVAHPALGLTHRWSLLWGALEGVW